MTMIFLHEQHVVISQIEELSVVSTWHEKNLPWDIALITIGKDNESNVMLTCT